MILGLVAIVLHKAGQGKGRTALGPVAQQGVAIGEDLQLVHEQPVFGHAAIALVLQGEGDLLAGPGGEVELGIGPAVGVAGDADPEADPVRIVTGGQVAWDGFAVDQHPTVVKAIFDLIPGLEEQAGALPAAEIQLEAHAVVQVVALAAVVLVLTGIGRVEGHLFGGQVDAHHVVVASLVVGLIQHVDVAARVEIGELHIAAVQPVAPEGGLQELLGPGGEAGRLGAADDPGPGA